MSEEITMIVALMLMSLLGGVILIGYPHLTRQNVGGLLSRILKPKQVDLLNRIIGCLCIILFLYLLFELLKGTGNLLSYKQTAI